MYLSKWPSSSLRQTQGKLLVVRQHSHQVLRRQKGGVCTRLQERAHVGNDSIPRDGLQSPMHSLPPVAFGHRFAAPPCLLQSVVEQDQIRHRPIGIAEKPQQVVEVSSLNVGTAEGWHAVCRPRATLCRGVAVGESRGDGRGSWSAPRRWAGSCPLRS